MVRTSRSVLHVLSYRNLQEWDQLASWAVSNDVYSDHVRWLIQVPRLYDIYRSKGGVKTFQDILGKLVYSCANSDE